MLPDGKTLTRMALGNWLKSTLQQLGINPAQFSGHSFRIGAATARGIGDATIQTLGRWKSDSYTRYIRIPRNELSTLSGTLA